MLFLILANLLLFTVYCKKFDVNLSSCLMQKKLTTAFELEGANLSMKHQNKSYF